MRIHRPGITMVATHWRGVLLAAPLLGLLLLATSAAAAEFVVNSSADPGDGVCDETECTLRQAILAANGNDVADTITFAQNLAGATIRLSSGALLIGNDAADPDLTIDGDVDGDGTPDITVDAQGDSGVFVVISANATLRGLVITGGIGEPVFGFRVGGGILNSEGILTVSHSTIRGNSAERGGGLANFNGMLTITHSTISGNTAVFEGGVVNLGGMLTITHSTINGNTAATAGGGIGNGQGALTVSNSTISGNTAATGGGLFNAFSGTAMVSHSTVSGNIADEGGGLHNGLSGSGGEIVIKSTIVVGNTLQDCVHQSGTFTSQGFNLVGSTSCGFTGEGDRQSVPLTAVLVIDGNGAPLLTDNGGPTDTIALSPAADNPARDAIQATACDVDTDQRGIARPQPTGGACDIGAFELVQAAAVTIADVIALFDQAVAAGTLVGAGPGHSAEGRLNALRNMLLTAGELLEQGDVEGACIQLQDAADRTDGAVPPPDFAQGPAADDLLEAITAVQDALGCSA